MPSLDSQSLDAIFFLALFFDSQRITNVYSIYIYALNTGGTVKNEQATSHIYDDHLHFNREDGTHYTYMRGDTIYFGY